MWSRNLHVTDQSKYKLSLDLTKNQSTRLITLAARGWKRVFYQSTKHRAELKLSSHLLNCTMFDLFRDFSLVFFFVNWRKHFGTSKPASNNRITKQGFVNMLSAVIYVIIKWAGTKIQRQNEMGSPNTEGFQAQIDCKLTYGNKNQTQLTLV